jgi:hypothetical protein
VKINEGMINEGITPGMLFIYNKYHQNGVGLVLDVLEDKKSCTSLLVLPGHNIEIRKGPIKLMGTYSDITITHSGEVRTNDKYTSPL